jgi:hypothetical protein
MPSPASARGARRQTLITIVLIADKPINVVHYSSVAHFHQIAFQIFPIELRAA